MVSGLGKRLVGILGYNQEPEAACEAEIICRPICFPQLRNVAVIHVPIGFGHGEAIAKANRAANRRRRKAADPDRRVWFLDWLGRDPNVLEIEELALEGDAFARESAANDV